MTSINVTNLMSVAAFAGIVLVILAWRILAHDRSVRVASVMVFTGALAVTFAAALVFAGLYRWTDHGIGLLVLGAALAFCGGDFYFQVIHNHSSKTGKRTVWVAAAGLGVAGMLFFGNITQITHSIQRDARHLNGVPAVFTSVHKHG